MSAGSGLALFGVALVSTSLHLRPLFGLFGLSDKR